MEPKAGSRDQTSKKGPVFWAKLPLTLDSRSISQRVYPWKVTWKVTTRNQRHQRNYYLAWHGNNIYNRNSSKCYGKPRTQMTLVLLGISALFWEGRPSKREVIWVPGMYQSQHLGILGLPKLGGLFFCEKIWGDEIGSTWPWIDDSWKVPWWKFF